MKGKTIFINHAKEDKDKAKILFLALKEAGHEPWIDSESIPGGDKWEKVIEQRIRSSDFFIAIQSNNVRGKRGYVQKEIRLAFDVLDLMPEGQIYFIPARLEDCEPSHERIREHQWIDLFPDWDRGVKEIIQSINLGLGESKPTKGQDEGNSKRVQTTITAQASEQMKDLQKRMGAKSDAEVLRRALELTKFFTDAQERGASIKIEEPKGSDEPETITIFIPST